jgi:hypothetical protein
LYTLGSAIPYFVLFATAIWGSVWIQAHYNALLYSHMMGVIFLCWLAGLIGHQFLSLNSTQTQGVHAAGIILSLAGITLPFLNKSLLLLSLWLCLMMVWHGWQLSQLRRQATDQGLYYPYIQQYYLNLAAAFAILAECCFSDAFWSPTGFAQILAVSGLGFLCAKLLLALVPMLTPYASASDS